MNILTYPGYAIFTTPIQAARNRLKSPSLTETGAKDSLMALAMINSDNFNFLQEYISCRNAGLSDLLQPTGSTDIIDQMDELGVHLHTSIKLFDALFHHGNVQFDVNSTMVALNELLGASAEIWPRFLPGEIDVMVRTGFTVNYNHPTLAELKTSAGTSG